MGKAWLNCRICKKKTQHAIFEDKYNLPKDKALVQCYECEAMGIETIEIKDADL